MSFLLPTNAKDIHCTSSSLQPAILQYTHRPWQQTGPSGTYWRRPEQLATPVDAGRLPTASPISQTHDAAVPTPIHSFTNIYNTSNN